MLQTVWKLLRPPYYEDEEKNRIARFLHVILLTTIGILLVATGITLSAGKIASAIATIFVYVPILLAYWANRTGHTHLSSYIVLFGAIAGLTFVLAVGQGIHDIGIINYGLILIVASYLLRRKEILWVALGLVASAAALVFGEFYGWLPIKNSPADFAPEVSDFFLVSLFLTLGTVAIFLLSTALQQSLEKTKNAELRWRTLVNSIPDTVVTLNTNGVIETVHGLLPETATGYVGKSISEILAPGQLHLDAELKSVLRGNTLAGEVQLLDRDGNLRWFWVSLGPRHQPNGRIDGIIAIVRDIQDKKDAEAELQASREALSARTRQLEILQEISRGVASLKDLPGTLHLALEQIKTALPLAGFVVTFYDPKTNLLSFPLVYDEGQFYEEKPSPLYPENVVAQSIYTRQTHILNRSEEELRHPVIPHSKRLGTKKVSASVVTAPMVVHGRVIGTISAHSYSLNTYNADHAAILSGAASQIAIAIENARLYETSRARAERLATLNEIGRSISALRDLNGVLESAYHLLRYVLPLDAFYIALYDPETRMISYPIVIDGGKKWDEASTPLQPDTQLSKTILSGEAYLVNRSAEEVSRRQANLPLQNALGEAEKVSASLMLAPLQFGGKVLGAISAQSYTLNAYTYDDLELLSGAATQIAIAIENARLYTALEKELAERKRAEAEVRTLNAELERRVLLRTRELEAAHKELASFTYTVSHDLRAPLRGIHGLTHIFLEDYGASLAPAAISHIRRIQENAHLMGRLIDELLAFTHLGRQALRQHQLDIQAMTQAIINDLMKTNTQQIEFIVQTMPHAYGDAPLVRQALTNLLSNAIKFSSTQEHPRIEVGSFEQEGEIVYFVRDNGVGFDMAYAGKLFGVFERLHRQDEFEGSGVGLAIVKRIINKHGGRVWAEGKVGQGATFFFTLPQKPTKPEKHS
ncbi:MAG: GAF domain-containing protein [Anaerolineales bacterium]|nr:GAF domain-containing protein [Anaerolineales bacterium]MCX7754574.1 GAF domain-containing protein [Anaerolineales bacterium]MDW8277187.1 GAF domain-containing protein [Anaerolineales bacterium]